MPSRWWLPLSGIGAPERVRLDHIHAAFSEWLDRAADSNESGYRHQDLVKPWFVTPLRLGHDGNVGVEVSTLDETTEATLAARPDNLPVRFGRVLATSGQPTLLATAAWSDLAGVRGECAWTLEFMTPTCHRSKNRISPLPAVDAILRCLTEYWNAFSGLPERIPAHPAAEIWVSQIDVTTAVLEVTISAMRNKKRQPSTLRVPGYLGTLTFECGEPEVADRIAALFHLATFVHIGSFARRGLGAARLTDVRLRSGRQDEARGCAG